MLRILARMMKEGGRCSRIDNKLFEGFPRQVKRRSGSCGERGLAYPNAQNHRDLGGGISPEQKRPYLRLFYSSL